MKFSEALENYLYAREVYFEPFETDAIRRAAKCSLEEAAARMDEVVAGTPAPPMQSADEPPVTGRWLDTK